MVVLSCSFFLSCIIIGGRDSVSLTQRPFSDKVLDLDLLVSRDVEHALLGGVGKGGGGLPLGRSAGSRLLHHLVDLLERETLGLGHEEVGVDESASAETAPHKEDGRLEVAALLADHVGGDDGDDGVPEPVGGGGETDTARADGEREDLADQDPGAGTPGGGEEEDEDGDEGDLRVDGVDVVGHGGLAVIEEVGLVEADGDTNDGDDELANQHAEGTPEEDGAATEALDGPEGDGGGEHVDDGEDHGDQELVLDGTGGLEEGGGVVEDEVDTSPGQSVSFAVFFFSGGHSQNAKLTIAASSEERYRG